jgi:hypothetical protein
MQEDEIESWYEAEKQKIEEEFLKGMEKGGNPEELRKVFDAKLKAAIGKYYREYQKILKPSEFSMKKKLLAKKLSAYPGKVTGSLKKALDGLSGTFKELR